MIKIRFLKNFALGLCLGAIAALSLSWALDSQVGEIFEKYAVYLFSAITTLTAASLALMSAITAIENQNRINEDNRLASLQASLAILPQELSNLHEICDNAINYLIDNVDYTTNTNTFNPDDATGIATIPELSISRFQNCIEFGHPEDNEWIFAILRLSQVYLARLRKENPVTSDITERLLEWATLKAIADQCFDYARRETRHIDHNFQSNRIESAFWGTRLHRLEGFPDNDRQIILNRINRLNGAPPFNL